MTATYLVRFDDICPTMNWAVWNEVEGLLVDRGIRPILAIVPDNRDPALEVNDAEPDFWKRARAWQARGWNIALHGYQHLHVTNNAGVVGINRRSEFAGLPPDEQERRLRAALGIFDNEQLRAHLWVAPSHSFDRTTVEILRSMGLTVLSDGLSLFPFVDAGGTTWVPQQLWRFRPLPCGVWTVCIHANQWTPDHIHRFSADLIRYGDRICELGTVVQAFRDRPFTPIDALAWRALRTGIRARRATCRPTPARSGVATG